MLLQGYVGATYPGAMQLEPPTMPEITDENLAEAAPRVRALLVGRYEEVWDRVKVRIIEDQAGTRPLDPRFLEIGLRALKETAAIYRLGRPAPVAEEAEDPTITATDRAALVLQALEELEAKRAAS